MNIRTRLDAVSQQRQRDHAFGADFGAFRYGFVDFRAHPMTEAAGP